MALVAGLAMLSGWAPDRLQSSSPAVSLRRVPHGGIQPEVAIDPRGVLHVVYFSGPPAAGNLFYVRSTDDGATFSTPVRVNSQDGSAVAVGTIRGAQLALGREGRVHVAWNGSNLAQPRGLPNPGTGQPGSPMLYARSNAQGTAFEPQRNVMTRTNNLDGGGSLAADAGGRVYVGWHANSTDGPAGEDARRVWLARSADDGTTFREETPVWSEATGACGCCGLRMMATSEGALHLLYRSAGQLTNRDIYALSSSDHGRTFRGERLHEWNIAACPMTSMSLVSSGNRVVGAWETDGQVYFRDIQRPRVGAGEPMSPPAGTGRRKHPRLAVNRGGDLLLVWTEGTAWARGGSLGWQEFPSAGPAGPSGARTGVPVWSFGAVAPRQDGGFVVFY
jgi:hypothetical protein